MDTATAAPSASEAPEVDLVAIFERTFGAVPAVHTESTEDLNAYQREMREQATQNKVDRWLAQQDFA